MENDNMFPKTKILSLRGINKEIGQTYPLYICPGRFYGCYDYINNIIYINQDKCPTLRRKIVVWAHEFVHYIQTTLLEMDPHSETWPLRVSKALDWLLMTGIEKDSTE